MVMRHGISKAWIGTATATASAPRRAEEVAKSFLQSPVVGGTNTSVGFVGLPNVGKSTLWNALTKQNAAASNFPFCTIDPNRASVVVPDPRLDTLAKIAKSAEIKAAAIEFVDIAGLIEGAAEGKGLGNQFLNDIRDVHAICHVVRCFSNANVTHVDGDGVKLNPAADFSTIASELALSDLQQLEKRRQSLLKKNKKIVTNQQSAIDDTMMLKVIDLCTELLEDQRPINVLNVQQKFPDPKELAQVSMAITSNLQLLSAKPALAVANVDEDSVVEGNQFSKSLKEFLDTQGIPMVTLSASLEDSATKSETEEARNELLSLFGLENTGLNNVLELCSKMLDVQCFYTIGPKEARAWKIRRGSTAVEAAAKIHSDISNGFISADVIKPSLFIELGGEQAVKQQGKLQLKGRDYIVEDGDVIHFRFKKPNK
jgi:GTP-binding protein YchF